MLFFICLRTHFKLASATLPNIIHHETWETVFESKPTKFATQWQRQPVVYRHNTQSPTTFFRLKDVNPLLHNTFFVDNNGMGHKGRAPTSPIDFSLVQLHKGKDKEWWAFPYKMKELNVEQASKAMKHGYSLIVNKVDHRWHTIHAVSKQLEFMFGQRVGTNLYLSPPVSQGFESHFDDHEVFVVQVHGHKHWRLYKHPFIHSPRTDQRFKPTLAQLKKLPHKDFVLNQGDVLYIPSGYVHDARVKDLSLPSLHLSFGVEVDVAFRWEGLLHQGIKLKFLTMEYHNSKYLRMLCHTAISLLATQSTNGLFGKALPSWTRGSTIFSHTAASFSLAWSKHLRSIESVIENQLVGVDVADGQQGKNNNTTLEEIKLHWETHQVLVTGCWRMGRNAIREVDSLDNGGPPPSFLEFVRDSLNTPFDFTKVKNIVLSIVKDDVLIRNAAENVEKEYVRRSSFTNGVRDRNAKQHEENLKLFVAEKGEL